MMIVPESIKRLVEQFESNIEYYHSPHYNETQVRVEFINPFFKALGWDVTNSQHVIHETRIDVEEDNRKKPKHPDYGFLINRAVRFFVEAKAPHVNLKGGVDPAFQVRRYGWSAKLRASILTDFEELSIYDCRVRPNRNDKPSENRLRYYTYTDYVDKWDEIAALLSYEAVQANKLDDWVEGEKTRGIETVDDAFLNEMETWRIKLAKDIALHNPHLTQRELNMAVQGTIDRIVFLRICEDREIELYGRLRDIQKATGIYDNLKQLFRQADAKYNSGLFHFNDEKGRSSKPDTISLDLTISDDTLSPILTNLYYPVSPYEFSVLPSDILGQIYERFLGKVIELTGSGKADVTEKPEVRKAGGVYYTPTYIVDYIVENTVGKLVVDAEIPDNVSKLRILDPACGSGSFLIGAYQFLLDWHLAYYSENNPKQWVKKGAIREIVVKTDGKNPVPTDQSEGGHRRMPPNNYALTTSEKKRILLNNIYGVDLDQQAVEVSKLSLLLKMLEGENAGTTQQTLLVTERLLPDLGDNIKWGNSLIGSDFYDGRQLGLFPEEELYKVNAFDWHSRTRGFGLIMENGGFDAVIGNPPYIQSRSNQLGDDDKRYYENHFQTVKYQINTYGLFIEQGINLLRLDGIMGFIVPNYWLSTDSDVLLRQYLFRENIVSEITNVYRVFTDATVDTLLLFATRPSNNSFPKTSIVRSINRELKTINDRLQAIQSRDWGYQEIYILQDENHSIDVSFTRQLSLRANAVLGDYLVFKFGMKPYEKGKGIPEQTRDMMKNKIYDATSQIDETYRPLLRARNVHRYKIEWDNNWIKYGNNLAAPRDASLFEGARIILQRIISSENIIATYSDSDFVCNTDVITAKIDNSVTTRMDIRYLLGIITSRLCAAFLRSKNVNLDRAAFPKINTNTLQTFPFHMIDFDDPADVARHDRMVALVERMLDLHRQLGDAKGMAQAQHIIESQIESTDREIDVLVYELYGLTAEEITLVTS